jgi:hypothetical protein
MSSPNPNSNPNSNSDPNPNLIDAPWLLLVLVEGEGKKGGKGAAGRVDALGLRAAKLMLAPSSGLGLGLGLGLEKMTTN